MASGELSDEEVEKYIDLLQKWNHRCRRALIAYNGATDRSAAANLWVGVPASVLSAIVATAVFSTLSKDPATGWRIATGLLALASALLAALQAFLKLDERAEIYRQAARRYGEERRRVEAAIVAFPRDRENAEALMAGIRQKLDEAAASAPANAPRGLWRAASKEIGEFGRKSD